MIKKKPLTLLLFINVNYYFKFIQKIHNHQIFEGKIEEEEEQYQPDK